MSTQSKLQWQELSPQAKTLYLKLSKEESEPPYTHILTMCRSRMEDASGDKWLTFQEVEHYIISGG